MNKVLSLISFFCVKDLDFNIEGVPWTYREIPHPLLHRSPLDEESFGQRDSGRCSQDSFGVRIAALRPQMSFPPSVFEKKWKTTQDEAEE